MTPEQVAQSLADKYGIYGGIIQEFCDALHQTRADALEEAKTVIHINSSPQTIRLYSGEMKQQEMRSVLAVGRWCWAVVDD